MMIGGRIVETRETRMLETETRETKTCEAAIQAEMLNLLKETSPAVR